MPGFDGTGPMGMGLMTSGGRGYCATPLSARASGYNCRSGYWGRRMPWRASWYVPQPTYRIAPEQELDLLREEAEAAREELKRIESIIEQLEKEKSEL